MFCFFPLIGAVIGGVSVGWYYLADYWGLNAMLYGAVAAAIPVLLTGGIHMDGYADTCDAIFSYGEPEKKLEILKDPRSGAFAVIYTCVYFLLLFGLFTQVYNEPFHIVEIGMGYVVSRILSGLAVVSMKSAKGSGLAHLFSGNADRRAVQAVLGGLGILLLAAGVWFSFHITPVSYTHLDVYKRQTYSNPVIARSQPPEVGAIPDEEAPGTQFLIQIFVRIPKKDVVCFGAIDRRPQLGHTVDEPLALRF